MRKKDTAEKLNSSKKKDGPPVNGMERKDCGRFVDMVALIRSIQRTEGHSECFRKAQGYCDQIDCAWRGYCLEDRGGGD